METCADGEDNDRDGYVDCDDFSCSQSENADVAALCGGEPEATFEACSDGIDNDGDGTIDYPADAACAHGNPSEIEGMRGRNEGSPAQCSDGIDNDGDGKTDYEPAFLDNGNPNSNAENGDPDCSNAFDNGEAS